MILGIILSTLGLYYIRLIRFYLRNNISLVLSYLYSILKGRPYKVPTKQDILNGKAYYQETQITTGNGIIKVYDIL